MTVLVTGYTGRVGRIVADTLVRTYQLRPRVLVRQAHLDNGLAADDVDLVAGDLDAPESLDAALDGVEKVFMVSPVHPDLTQRETALGRRAALKPTPPAIVKVSGLGTSLDSYVDSGRWHAQAEHNLRETGLTVTSLRPAFFMQNLAFSLKRVRASGQIESGVGDAAIAMVDVRDIAEVAAAALAGPTPIDGQSVLLTGPAALTYEDVAAILAVAMGRDVSYVPQSIEDVQRALASGPMPEWHQSIMLQFNRAFREGLGAEVADTVRQVLGRTPRSLSDWVADQLSGKLNPGANNPFPNR